MRPRASRSLFVARLLLASVVFLVVGVLLGVIIGTILGWLVALAFGIA
jgi:Na+(H+)/acetate symporter ActP